MKSPLSLFLLVFAMFFLVLPDFAQDDETRQATGLPMQIGVPVVSGKITLQGLDPSKPKPNIFIVVYFNGGLFDKRQPNDTGNYVIPNVPREGVILAVEVDGVEAVRYQLPSSIIGSRRQDFTLNPAQFQNAKPKNGVISAKSFYQRTDENEKLFDKAAAAAKEKKSDNAITIFKQLLKNDSKDFVAWTELGTLFFKIDKFSDAEESYNKALEQKPDFMVALVNLGKLYLMEKQSDKAILILTKAVETEPQSADSNHYLGEAYLQIKKGSKAVGYLNEAIRLAPVEKAEIHLRLAALYNGAGMKDKAAAEYKTFLEKVPNYQEKDQLEKYIKENPPK